MIGANIAAALYGRIVQDQQLANPLKQTDQTAQVGGLGNALRNFLGASGIPQKPEEANQFPHLDPFGLKGTDAQKNMLVFAKFGNTPSVNDPGL